MNEIISDLLESLDLLSEASNKPTETVSIDLFRYEELVLKERFLSMLAEAVYQGASISKYDTGKLTLDTSSIETFLRVADAPRYCDVFNKLKGEQDGTDKD